MKIAGVSVNIENLPTKQELIRMALNTKTYQDDSNALESINQEIKASGLYRNISKATEFSSKSDKESGEQRDTEQGEGYNEA